MIDFAADDAGIRAQIGARLDAFTPRTAELADSRRAAVTIAVTSVNGVHGIWLTRRPAKMREHGGQFALPGGRLDTGEDSETAALRELHEEIGVEVDRSQVLGRLDDYPTRSGYVITPIVCWAGADRDTTTSVAEVEHLYFVPMREVAGAPRFITIPESPRPVIQLPLLGFLVHAPTAAMIHQFAEVVLHDRHTRVDEYEQPVFAWR